MNKLSLKMRLIVFLSIFLIWGILRFFLMMKIKALLSTLVNLDHDTARTLFGHFMIVLEAFFLYFLYIFYQKKGWLQPIKVRAKGFYILGILVGVGIFLQEL